MKLPGLRPVFRIGFERSSSRRKRTFIESEEKAEQPIQPPKITVIEMSREELKRLPVFRYHG